MMYPTYSLPFDTVYQAYIIKWRLHEIIMKSIGDIEEDLADKTEPILGFRPSSKIKRGPIGIVISIICVVIVLLELNRSGVI
tara:strand:- start:817 stop:1062 length:246 start_codon:yes stop_codon:yes gene_type:complete